MILDENTKRITLTLLPDHYLKDDEKCEYDIKHSSLPYKVAESDAYGMMCLISFLGKWKVKEDKDFSSAISKEVQLRLGEKTTDEERWKEYAHLGKETNWFHTFSNGDWDAAEKQYKEDAAIRSRFNPFATYWWKIVCEVIFTKIQNKTYDNWIAEIRDNVGKFLDDGVKNNKFNEQYYNVSYKNYKSSYDLVGRIAYYLRQMLSTWTEVCLHEEKQGKIDTKKEGWGINSFSCYSNATRIIYDKNDMFHLFINASLNTINGDRLRKECLKTLTEMKCEKCDAVGEQGEIGWVSCECMGDYCPSHSPTNSCDGECDCKCDCCDWGDDDELITLTPRCM